MRNAKACIPILLALCASGAHAACSRESAPAIPDGGSATQAEMTTAQAAVKAYVASGNAYLACMQPALDSADTPAEQKAVLTAEYNAAVDEMQAVAASWKAAVSAFKAK